MEHPAVLARGQAAQAELASQDLEIVVPFTTPELTKAALREAETLSAGLGAHVRLIKVQVAPFPLDLNRPPVALSFLREQLASMPCNLPVTVEVYLARDADPALLAALRPDDITVLASKRRPWRTSQERLAAGLRRAGHQVLVRYQEKKDA